MRGLATIGKRTPGMGAAMMGGGGIKYLFRDLFTTDRAAGAVNATASEPGPGTRTVTDTGSQLSISGGLLKGSGTAPGNSNPLITISGNITRAPGICGRFKYRHLMDGSGSLALLYTGFHGSSFANSHYVYSNRSTSASKQPNVIGLVCDRAGGANNSAINSFSDVWNDILIRLRTTGAAYYRNLGTGYRLFYVSNVSTATPLTFGVKAGTGVLSGFDIDNMEIPQNTWIQKARVSDSFDRADGAPGVTDGLGCEEGGGAGFAWSDVLGTMAIATNKAAFAALTGGVGMAVLDAGETNTYIMVQITRTAGEVGIVYKYIDANNYQRLTYDGTNLIMTRVYNGTATALVTQASTYLADGWLAVSLKELTALGWYNAAANTLAGDVKFQGSASTPFPLGGTKVGLYSTDAGNTFNNFCVFDAYPNVPFPGMVLPGWTAFGDSLTDKSGRGELMRRLQMAGHLYEVRDYGVGGQTTVTGLLRFASNVLTKSDSIVSIQMGVNDLWSAGVPAGANTVKANLQSMYTAAKAAGKTVIAVSLFPCKGAAAYSADVQTNLDAINAWLLDPENGPGDVDYVVDAYAVLEDPATPDTLLPAYDDTSHLHLSQDGYAAVADAVIAAVFGA